MHGCSPNKEPIRARMMKFILMNSLRYQSIHTNVLILTNHKKENNLSSLHYIAI